MTQRQFSGPYGILATLSCGDSVETIVSRIKVRHPALAAEAKLLLDKYVSLCDKKEFRPGNGYIDIKAAKKVFESFDNSSYLLRRINEQEDRD